MSRLTKENFFDNLMEAFPKQMQQFCDWIDEYKEREKWHLLFQPNVKFHDIPFDMQYGIMYSYFGSLPDTGPVWSIMVEDDFSIKNKLMDFFATQAYNELQHTNQSEPLNTEDEQ